MNPDPSQPPACCPACGANQIAKSNDIDTWYACSQLYQLVDGEWKRNKEWDCREAFSAALARRQQVAALTAELAEAKRYSDHLEHEGAALAVLHSNAVDERNALTARAEKAEATVKKWDELRRVIAQSLEVDPETWPEHGNAPLAVSASYFLLKLRLDQLDTQLTALRAQLAAVTEAGQVASDAFLSMDKTPAPYVVEYWQKDAPFVVDYEKYIAAVKAVVALRAALTPSAAEGEKK